MKKAGQKILHLCKLSSAEFDLEWIEFFWMEKQARNSYIFANFPQRNLI